MHMGDYIAIEQPVGPFEFACESVSTGTPFIAVIDKDKREMFQDRTFLDHHPSACPFLRPDGDRIRCTIHETGPCQCRSYRCEVMKIFNREGARIGTVNGNLSLHSDDPHLRVVWEEADRKINDGSEGAEMRLQQYLTAKGYRVE